MRRDSQTGICSPPGLTHPLLAPPAPRWLTLAGDKLGEPQGRGAVPSLLGAVLGGLLWRA